MKESEVRAFWNAHPCGAEMVGGIRGDYEEFIKLYDTMRYSQAPSILKCLDAIDFKNKKVLEIGLGLGADAEQIIRRGAIWTGIDLTQESVNRVAERLKLHNLPYDRLEVGSACRLPFDTNSFDLVFSYGVLHHIPEIKQAQSEIARVLKPNGQLIAMLYAKNSLNYLVSIMLLRRISLILLYASGLNFSGKIGQHIDNAKQAGLFHYLQMNNFIHRNTDGPLNPYSKVYNLKEVRKDFHDFHIVKNHKEFMWAPPLPITKFPLASLLGWHLWVHMKPIK